jgi:hypothetical protein
MTEDDALKKILPHVSDGFVIVCLTRENATRAYWRDMEVKTTEHTCTRQLAAQGIRTNDYDPSEWDYWENARRLAETGRTENIELNNGELPFKENA